MKKRFKNSRGSFTRYKDNPIMNEGLPAFFSDLLARTDGCLAVLVTDRDGVPVVKVSNKNCPEPATRGSFLATFSTATEQASKLGLSKNKNMICLYPSYQVVMFNFSPLVVSIIAKSTANTGMILALETEFSGVLKELCKVIGTS